MAIAFLIIFGSAFIIYDIYTLIPHKGWGTGAHPDMDAKIIVFKVDKGLPGIKDRNNRTVTIYFSDRFYYKSYRYNCINASSSNQAEAQMREKAIAAHKEAVRKAK